MLNIHMSLPEWVYTAAGIVLVILMLLDAGGIGRVFESLWQLADIGYELLQPAS